MGWGNCGRDDRGRKIGYYFVAKCDQQGCKVKIDRGLSHVCGNMHGGDELGCGQYYCTQHLICVETKDGRSDQLCEACYAISEREGCLASDDDPSGS